MNVLKLSIYEFVSDYLNEQKLEWLVKSLIETIHYDPQIPSDCCFLISTDENIVKSDFNDIESLELEPFLLSVIHFIITYRTDNKKGRETFEKLYKQKSPRHPWKLNFPIGTHFRKEIFINRYSKNHPTLTITEDDKTIASDNKSVKSKVIKKDSKPLTLESLSPSNLYNLIVGGIEKATFTDNDKYVGEFFINQDRVITETWCDKLHTPLSNLGVKEREFLMTLPTIFAVDQGPKGDNYNDLAYFGYIKKIQARFNLVKVVFELSFAFKQHELYKNSFEFAIDDFELYNTHWAVKDVDIISEMNYVDVPKLQI